MVKYAIIGAGISGLSLGWYLKKRFGSDATITIFEEKSVPGGLIQTATHDSSLYELGPHSYRGEEILALAEELGIRDAVISSSEQAQKKYLVRNGALVTPAQLWPQLVCGVARGLMSAARAREEESVAQFFVRRYGQQFCDTFIDPLVRGIWAGDARRLSMQSCFPQLCSKWSLLKMLFRKKPIRSFSFCEGAAFLPRQLAAKIEADIVYNTAVVQLLEKDSGVEVVTAQGGKIFDMVYVAIPAYAIGALLPQDDPLQSLVQQIVFTPVTTVSIGYRASLLTYPGFGFLASSCEEKELLGCVFDSAVFPEHNGAFATRLTFMLRERQPVAPFLQQYLDINQTPDFIHTHTLPCAIAQYAPGHAALLRAIEEQQRGRRIALFGASFYGSAVSDCVKRASLLLNQESR